MNKIILLVVLLFSGVLLSAQMTINGHIVSDNGEGLIGCNIIESGSSNGAISDVNGDFSLVVTSLPTELTISYTGYNNLVIEAANAELGTLTLSEGLFIDDVVVVGTRFAPRTAISSPVPIDNIRADELINTGQTGVDRMLTFKIPSYNATQQTISDATAHFDPAELRGLGPSRTLVLVNGKRKNASSLVYINDTPGKGEVGVDMKSIPAAAIERVEVLRDGASAQYGSDAIAGVINVILKDDYEYTDINIHSGVTTESDGFNYGYDVNTGFKVGEKGYLNLTASFNDQEETNRAPSPGVDLLFGEDATNPALIANPSMGMRVGTPNMRTSDVFFNGKVELNKDAHVYAFGGLTHRDGLSYALYRMPYWITDDFGLLTPEGEEYDGFQPTFETDILDNTLAVGIKGKKGDWNYDLSLMNGSNSVDYTIGGTINPALGAASPTTFNAGGYTFSSTTTNLDLGRSFGNLSVGLGTELRRENFSARAGEEASYIEGGAQSFPGLQPQNEVDAVRYNIGAYLDLNYDITDDFLIGGAIRAENYSDFGDNTSFKILSRYKLMEDKLVIRASYSTGFRAPSLHQIYLSNVQTLVSGGTISNQGTFNNNSSVLNQLGVAKLKDEKAVNFTVGIATRPLEGLSLSVDYYNIAVDDRIVYSSSIDDKDTSVVTLVDEILISNKITSLKFFTNAVNTITSGIDFVANYNFMLGSGKVNVLASLNINDIKLDGAIITPAPIANANVELFDRKEQSRILSSRPNQKVILGIGYEIGDFELMLNNTYFGEVTWQHATDPGNDQTFAGKTITDLFLKYRFSKTLALSVSANNLLDVYPDEIDPNGDPVTDLGGRFKYPWEVNQFGFNGTTLSANLNVRF